MDVALVMSRSDGTRRTFPLRKDRIVVGRTSSCDLRIPLSSVSRQHCELNKDDHQVRLRDLGSSNGTFCNDKRIQEVVLEPGDKITVGTVLFQVVINGQPNLMPEPVVRSASPVSKSGRTGVAMKSPVNKAVERDDLDAELEAAITEAGGDATPLESDDPIAALEAMATSEIDLEDDRDEDDAPPADKVREMTETLGDDDAPRPSRNPRPQPRA